MAVLFSPLPDRVAPVFVQVVSPPLDWSPLSYLLAVCTPSGDMQGPSVIFEVDIVSVPICLRIYMYDLDRMNSQLNTDSKFIMLLHTIVGVNPLIVVKLYNEQTTIKVL